MHLLSNLAMKEKPNDRLWPIVDPESKTSDVEEELKSETWEKYSLGWSDGLVQPDESFLARRNFPTDWAKGSVKSDEIFPPTARMLI